MPVLVGRDSVVLPHFNIIEGVIWLIIATAAELPQVVSLTIFIVVRVLFFPYFHFTP